jgi:hypothetical protein
MAASEHRWLDLLIVPQSDKGIRIPHVDDNITRIIRQIRMGGATDTPSLGNNVTVSVIACG